MGEFFGFGEELEHFRYIVPWQVGFSGTEDNEVNEEDGGMGEAKQRLCDGAGINADKPKSHTDLTAPRVNRSNAIVVACLLSECVRSAVFPHPHFTARSFRAVK
jgi:hypothetical protein